MNTPLGFSDLIYTHFLGTQILKSRLQHETDGDYNLSRLVHYNAPTLRSHSYVDRHSRNSSPSETPIQPQRNFPTSAAIPSDRSKQETHPLNNGHVATGYHSEVMNIMLCVIL